MDKAYLSQPEITVIIGGSEGVDERVRSKADLRLSFGRVTFPHQLMRLMLTEQIYRAFNITANTPYHK
jgi:23S rRNA (pseudouridine1915-N3)-methyltransferase